MRWPLAVDVVGLEHDAHAVGGDLGLHLRRLAGHRVEHEQPGVEHGEQDEPDDGQSAPTDPPGVDGHYSQLFFLNRT
jgi:hypothetical protein